MPIEDNEMLELKRKITGLQRTVLWLAIILVASYASILLVFSRTASVRWVAINDRQGHVTGWWDDQGLQIFDSRGNPRLRLGMVGDQPSVQMFDSDRKLKAQVFLYTDGSGYLMLWDKNGKGARFPVPENTQP